MKKNRKEDPKKREKFLNDVVTGLRIGESNESIDHIKLIEDASKKVKKNYPTLQKLAEDTQHTSFKKQLENQGKILVSQKEDHTAFFNFFKEKTDLYNQEQKKKAEELKKQNKFWYKTKSIVRAKYFAFKLKMKEVSAFIKHEFLTIRKLIFFINDLFFGAQHKNRKLLYGHKNLIIKQYGYGKGEVRFNSMVRNITKGAELNKRLLEMDKA